MGWKGCVGWGKRVEFKRMARNAVFFQNDLEENTNVVTRLTEENKANQVKYRMESNIHNKDSTPNHRGRNGHEKRRGVTDANQWPVGRTGAALGDRVTGVMEEWVVKHRGGGRVREDGKLRR